MAYDSNYAYQQQMRRLAGLDNTIFTTYTPPLPQLQPLSIKEDKDSIINPKLLLLEDLNEITSL